MTVYNSIEAAQRNATTAAGTPLAPTSLRGKERTLKFSWTTISSVSTDTVFIGTLPKGASVAGGRVDFAAHGVSVSGAIGTSSNAAYFMTASTVSAAGQVDFANTAALHGMLSEVLTADTDIYWTFSGAANASGTPDVYGYIKYVVD